MVSIRMLNLSSSYQLAASAVVCLAALWISPQLALGALFGGLLMAGNFGVMKYLAKRLDGQANPQMRILLLWPVKFVAALAILALLVLGMGVDVLGLGIGMSTLVLGVTLGMLHNSMTLEKAST